MNNLIDALLKAQNEIDHAVKDGTTHFGGYPTLEAVINTVKPPLNKYGIYFLQKTHPSETGATVETIFYGHGSELSAGLFSLPATKNNAQQFGSALTYCRRYSLATACGIGAKDDDGQESTNASNDIVEDDKPENHVADMLKDLEDEQPKRKSESDKIYQRHLETFQITDDKEVQAELTSAYVKWVEDKKAAKAKKDEDIL
tara:strand:- start:48 stop:650 length:603 start_codon:yes stop_codon:yes gene_type:complete